MSNHKQTKQKTILTAESTPTINPLNELSDSAWADFSRDFHHYQVIGGTKQGPELVDRATLDLISDLSGVTEFSTATEREKAKKAIDALFASQTTQNLYDRLIACASNA
ncbi:hypothetical protein ADUPG1_003625 [Aduncisulcus paluster]|uniref:Uncharacterized protein n=1 Tax=Aduncisulcus paluster TaxID=2918883 RepID=A0ABQ5KZ26_9EUKA|nr:hypothetical protein ADUPG1_003625 [Aduncisulcus paluster]